jgi:CheY-like chemotaxis protein
MKKIKAVLLIDDDEPTNFIHKKIIQGTDLVEAIHIAHSGQEALNFLSRKDNEKPIPDLIFLDINMPAMDGWEFLAQYKMLTNTATEKIIIVMLTTSLNPDDEMKAAAIKEVYGYKNKPLTRLMLEEIVIKYF